MKTIVALEGPKMTHRAFFGPSKAVLGPPTVEGVAPKGTGRFPKGIHGVGTSEIDTVWDYKADGALFEGVLLAPKTSNASPQTPKVSERGQNTP